MSDSSIVFPCTPNQLARDMTVRTWLIGQALAGICHDKIDADESARWAIAVADEVLAQTRSPAEKG
jgi:hypothetical protein